LEMSLTHNYADSRGDTVNAGEPRLSEAALRHQPRYPTAT